jgi:hypothetical protein
MDSPVSFLGSSCLRAIALLLGTTGILVLAAPPGPEAQIPEDGAAPGAFPNTSVSAVNVIAKGSSVFNSSVEVPGFEGQGPIPWALNRYNRGDFALRLAPGNPAAALGNLGQGFIEFGDSSPALPASQAWRPSPTLGVVIPTARQNGPVDWGDGEGAFYPTVAVAWASSGPGYSMVNGQFANGDLDVNTGRAGTHSSSPEANFSFSTVWFPFDQGWLGGDVAGPGAEGASQWSQPTWHAAGLSAGLIRWLEYPEGGGVFGGLARLTLPGVNTLEDGMLFATSSDGASDVNLVGVAPVEQGAAWLVTVREDAATDAETLADAGQSEFQFVYVPFDAPRLIGGHILGSDGSKRKVSGEFAVNRTATGTYELEIPGKTITNGTLILQVAELEPGTATSLASRAFLSYEYVNGKFVIQARKTTSDTAADLADASFYFAWIDFNDPLAMPAGPRLRSQPAVVVSGEGVTAREAMVAASTHEPEVLVTTIDLQNAGGFTDPITGQLATSALVGRFHDARTLQATSEPFMIVGNPSGILSRSDVKYNPVSHQYVVVSNGRTYNDQGLDVILVALVNSSAQAGGNSPVAKAFVHDFATDQSYDDVAVAVSSKTGNFLIVAERKFADEGEGTVGALYSPTGTLLTPALSRLDRLQSVGDEDDPDVIYHQGLGAFIYLANTDNSNGSTGTLSNRIVASVVNESPDAQSNLVVRVEQPIGDGQPAGTPEGHPAALANPFNGQLITAFDAGNATANGTLSYIQIGASPGYAFSSAHAEVPYLSGSAGNPFKHQHPQLAADPSHGVIVIGFNATTSDLGLPEAYVFRILGPDGLPLPGQTGDAYFLADSPGGLGTSANYHTLVYSPTARRFLAAFNSAPGITYLAGLEITSTHLVPAETPELNIALGSGQVIMTWPASAQGYALEQTDSLATPAWHDSGLTPSVAGDLNRVTVTPSGAARFYRLANP